MEFLKAIASHLPHRWQQTMKRVYFGARIRIGKFITDEPEFGKLDEWVREGDWVLDIGANVGHYALRLSQIVGASGRVIAFEPIPDTFELLASNCQRAHFRNISLVNAAASDSSKSAGMGIPMFPSGLKNYYMASLGGSGGDLDVLTVTVDAFQLPHQIALIKLDVEGHELPALRGMSTILRRDHPTLIVEGTARAVEDFLADLGYRFTSLPGSPNRVYSLR